MNNQFSQMNAYNMNNQFNQMNANNMNNIKGIKNYSLIFKYGSFLYK